MPILANQVKKYIKCRLNKDAEAKWFEVSVVDVIPKTGRKVVCLKGLGFGIGLEEVIATADEVPVP